ncbi:hypothetical protein [Flavobacterium sp. WV_118_3]|uniref:hypothetical protein n=1 Tax=Flavobacterium sp. WV_118_3 TaxID=3151764 RepID=UPI003219FFC7
MKAVLKVWIVVILIIFIGYELKEKVVSRTKKIKVKEAIPGEWFEEKKFSTASKERYTGENLSKMLRKDSAYMSCCFKSSASIELFTDAHSNHCVKRVIPDQKRLNKELHCKKLNDLFKSVKFKKAIRYLKMPQVLDGVKEQGFNLSVNEKKSLVVSEVPEKNTGSNHVNYSKCPLLFGGIHCHLKSYYAMFSATDLFMLDKFYSGHNFIRNKGNRDPSLPVHLLVSTIGVYAISADNLQTLEKLREIYSNNGKRKNFRQSLEKKYKKIENKSFPVRNYQNAFLEFLHENELEISLYKANNDLTSWHKLVLKVASGSNAIAKSTYLKQSCDCL